MKRREFIKRIAQTTAVVSTTALSTSRVLGANERVGIGVIGCGLIGRIHTRSFVSLPAAQVVAMPDHWHALHTMMACAAGKDVYCEKPLTLFVREGRWMIDVARRFKRVVQVGTQQRSGP